MNDILEGRVCDEEGNLTPEVAQRVSGSPGGNSTGGAFDEAMATMIEVPVGLFLFLLLCTLILFLAIGVAAC